jgi:hypothetical protein
VAQQPSTGELKIVGMETATNTVPADVLAQTLRKMQRLVLIVAAAQEGQQFHKRFKPSSTLRRRHSLRCGVPKAGSYAVPLAEVDEEPSSEPTAAALRTVYEVVDAVRAGPERVRHLFPDGHWRALLLQELQETAPEEGDNWEVDLSVGSAKPHRIDYQFRREVIKLQRADQPTEEAGAVIGTLQKIDFANKAIVIRHPTTEQAIECSYNPEIEVDLFESRLEPVQVVGQVLRNQDGNVVRVTDVSMIQAVNLARFEISKIEGHGRRLVLNPPLSVQPVLDEDTKQVFLFDEEALDLHVAAATRAALYDDIADDLLFAWEQYALAADDDLAPSALEFKKLLKRRIKEEPLGPKT